MKLGRRILSLTLCAAMAITLLAGCESRNKDDASSSSSQMSSSSMPSSSSRDETLSSSSSSSSESSSSSSSNDSSSMDSSSMSEPSATAGAADFSQIGALSGEPVTWGPGKQFDDENRSIACTGLQETYSDYNCIFIGDSSDKHIYLTFDQGYENGYTPVILDVLKEKQVPAVFFLTGQYVKTSPDLVQRMIDEGHVLGNHSNHHYDVTEVPIQQAQQDLMELHEMVQDQFGYSCSLYRFPEGKFSEQGLALAEECGYKSVFWSFAYADWDPENQPDPTTALQTLKDRLHCGAIYLLHSVSSTNAAILGDFIDAARAQGYEFAALEA